jgi:threonine synthase
MSPAEEPRPSRLSGLACPACEARFEDGATLRCPDCGGPLSCRYELEGLESAAGPGEGLLRWSALLPVRDAARLRDAGDRPAQALDLPGLAAELELSELTLLRTSGHPSGSGSSRGFSVVAASLNKRGAGSLTLASAGPTAAPLATAAKRQGLSCRVAIPSGSTPLFRLESRLLKARVVAVLGDRGVAGDWVRAHPGDERDRDVSAFAEPYRLEGAKTLAFEIAELEGALPDTIVVPTGSGLDLVALAKGFEELRAAGFLDAPTPRLVAAQVEGCAPLVRALDEQAEEVTPWGETQRTLAESLRDPAPAGGLLALKVLRETEGAAQAVSEGELVDALRRTARLDGILPGPEGAVGLAALTALCALPEVPAERVLCLDPNAIWRSPECLEAAGTG